MPTGAVAVASSTGGRLTLYGKDQHQASDTKKFERAHAVLWDPENRLLWALGGDQLCSYRIGGSASAPRFDAGKRCKQLPLDGPRKHGESLAEAVDAHDLSPVHGNPAELWFSTRHAVYVYNIRQSSIRRAPGSISQLDIKSVGNQAGGWVATSQAKHANPPPPGKTIPTWGSPNIWLYNPMDRISATASCEAPRSTRPARWSGSDVEGAEIEERPCESLASCSRSRCEDPLEPPRRWQALRGENGIGGNVPGRGPW